MNEIDDFIEHEFERLRAMNKESEKKLLWSFIKLYFVSYMLIRHPGKMGMVALGVFIIVCGITLWVINVFVWLLTGIDLLALLHEYAR